MNTSGSKITINGLTEPSFTCNNLVAHQFLNKQESREYSLRLKINAIVRPNTQTNARCEITKIPFVLYEKDLDIVLSLL